MSDGDLPGQDHKSVAHEYALVGIMTAVFALVIGACLIAIIVQ